MRGRLARNLTEHAEGGSKLRARTEGTNNQGRATAEQKATELEAELAHERARLDTERELGRSQLAAQRDAFLAAQQSETERLKVDHEGALNAEKTRLAGKMERRLAALNAEHGV